MTGPNKQGNSSPQGTRENGRGTGPGLNNSNKGGVGRGGGRMSIDKKIQIVAPKRESTLQVASEGTDDLIVAVAADEAIQHLASFVMRKDDFKNFTGQRQIRIFVNSCLLNLSNHHTVDTSGIMSDLASKNGVNRMTDIMNTRMGVDCGNDRGIISLQYVVLPFIGVLTRESICQSTMIKESGIIFSTVFKNREVFLEGGVLKCMDHLIRRRSMQDKSPAGRQLPQQEPVCQITSLQAALLAITRLVYQIVKRSRDSRIEMSGIIKKLQEQHEACISVTKDTAENHFLNEILRREVNRLCQIVNDAEESTKRPARYLNDTDEYPMSRGGHNKPFIDMAYDPPGILSEYGPRHDNDELEISNIKLLPTQDEITCTRTPFLPSNGIQDAPHFLPSGWKRQLDIHFRLYREDLLDSIRRGLMGFIWALERTNKENEDRLLRNKEIRKIVDNNVSLNVYGNVRFLGINCSKNMSGAIEILFDQPLILAGKAKAERTEFWERSKRRFMVGSLVCIARRTVDSVVGDDSDSEASSNSQDFHMVLGVVAKREIEDLSKDEIFARIHITLANPKDYLMMIDKVAAQTSQWFLVESMGGFLEAYRPILKALQNCVPASLPFGKYIAPTAEELEDFESNDGITVDPPLYARAPGFQFDLSVLLNGFNCELDVNDSKSIKAAEIALQQHSTLDNTQAVALVETLCREVAIISGPPGTGKTKIGVDLMRVLLHNRKEMNCGPILCICYTNHALDQFLEHLLDNGISKVVRIGTRSRSTRLADYNIDRLLESKERPYGVRQALRSAHMDWATVSQDVKKLEKILSDKNLHWEYVSPYLATNHYEWWEQIAFFTSPIAEENEKGNEEESNDGFKKVEGKNANLTPYQKWISGHDIEIKISHNEKVSASLDSTTNRNFYDSLSETPEEADISRNLFDIPNSDRILSELADENVWEMSISERRRLQESWQPNVQQSMIEVMGSLLDRIQAINQSKDNAYDDVRRSILRETMVIGMTTNGAAKFQNLVSAVAPKIIICEEAGEVLESHILATLSASTQHLILIGDHKQLRPSIGTYELSSDSARGRNFNLDLSLFERLVTDTLNPFPLSHLTVQRRMRPEISSLIRNTLYPRLEDGENVNWYPEVPGMGKNLHFMDHKHPEDTNDEFGMSYANSFEVRMVEALAQHLIKNGYDKPGDIAVLTPYLGQLSKLRDYLRKKFVLLIDEREQEELDAADLEREHEDDESKEKAKVVRVGLQKHLTLRTIDNYQGEEAKIVIVSLVRSNVKDDGTRSGRPSIGFLKSPNRTNVLLSRAQHGMYIIGNANLMDHQKNGMWPEILSELRSQECVSFGFPIVCKNHPGVTNTVYAPEDFNLVAPFGGCTAKCGKSLACGHECPLNCHPDNRDHLTVRCTEPCPRTHSKCDHQCTKLCGDKCGTCMEIVDDIALQCGHILKNPRCWESKDSSKVKCQTKITRKFTTCEHEQVFECHIDVKQLVCSKKCGSELSCGHKCERACAECQSASKKKKAEKTISGHIIRNHATTLTAADLAATLVQLAARSAHGDVAIKVAASCLVEPRVTSSRDPSSAEMVVDTSNNRTLHEINPKEDLIIALSCGHALTMASLDKMMEMSSYYESKVVQDTGAVIYTGIKGLTDGNIAQKSCHICHKPITCLYRYGRRIKAAQLAQRSKKHQVSQTKLITNARRAYDVARLKANEKEKDFLEAFVNLPSESSGTPPTASSRVLGKHTNPNLLPFANIENVSKVYGISKLQEDAWKNYISYIGNSLATFANIYKMAQTSPYMQLSDAASTYLNRINDQLDVDLGSEQEIKPVPHHIDTTSPDFVKNCIEESGLPINGYAGSSYVDSLQERTYVLNFAVSKVTAIINALDNNNQNSGTNSGWYWFLEDLLLCTMVHIELLQGLAQKAGRDKTESIATLMKLDLILQSVSLITSKPIHSGGTEVHNRNDKIQVLEEEFKDKSRYLREKCPKSIKLDCLPKIVALEKKMKVAVQLAEA
ncbi:hypothetical protein BGZ76_008735 [Entomortierella beljakovae]|nr:hypothetical protein BGZ76_008735 [Entomortierella beljakovae]